MKKFQLPYGVQDFLPDDCFDMDVCEERIAEAFYRRGYEKIRTAAINYYDLFDGAVLKGGIDRMFKLTDSDGSLLVLRPDPTLQVCRMAAAKLDLSIVNKLYYVEPSFEYLPDNSAARSREFAQAGVELLGPSGISGDIEIVSLAVEALLAAGCDDFLIELGHSAFFEELSSKSGLAEQDVSELRRCINNKDALGIELLLKDKTDSAFISAFTSLTRYFGGYEVIEKVLKLCDTPACLRAAESLKEIFRALEIKGYSKYLCVDLGLLKGYYDGIIIRGMSKGFGLPLLEGGRYDRLLKHFNALSEAVGFSVGVKRLADSLKNSLPSRENAGAAYISADAYDEYEETKVKELEKKFKRVTKVFEKSEDGLIAYCEKNNIKNAAVISNKTCKIITVGRKNK